MSLFPGRAILYISIEETCDDFENVTELSTAEEVREYIFDRMKDKVPVSLPLAEGA